MRCVTSISLFLWISVTTVLASDFIPDPENNLNFNHLATRWDEAIPLGNGMLGALVWGEGPVLRLSLDRADLWDSRPIPEFQKPEFTFDFLYKQVLAGDLKPVQELVDIPYDRDPAPTKIPAGRLEFDQTGWGEVEQVSLDIAKALCTVRWKSGVTLQTYVHAMNPVGFFIIQNASSDIHPVLVPPPFGGKKEDNAQVNSLSGHALSSLGYPEPHLENEERSLYYEQEGWGGFRFAIACSWKTQTDGAIVGAWTVVTNEKTNDVKNRALTLAAQAVEETASTQLNTHKKWWESYWKASALDLPDPVLEKQWYLEQYKFGSASRRGAPPISLQAVWTADERRVPPWKGDYHHDLNTQLSYWPCYSANHLDEGLAYLDWLWKVKPTAEKYTQQFYGIKGLNFPGITTLAGEPMGGWNQYSCSPTTAAWLAQHFYLHWRYSGDSIFLKERAYPFIRDAANFLDNHMQYGNDRPYGLPLSSSPEIGDNRLEAWFRSPTNYDLALIRSLYRTAINLANLLNQPTDAVRWSMALRQIPDLALDQKNRLLVAPDTPLKESHRHFSHLMGIYPLGIVDNENGKDQKKVIEASLQQLEELGPDFWCGYSYAWQGSLYARALQGEKAAAALRIFADCFTSPNSFHLNGDQSGTGKSKFTYRPFTLEGNFAFAAGIQEMLLQSHTGTIRVFPAIPDSWKDVEFKTFRTEGAFLVSARKVNGRVEEVRVFPEIGGQCVLENPFQGNFTVDGLLMEKYSMEGNNIILKPRPGHIIQLKAE